MDEGRPIIAITMGDPAGIGAEIILKALLDDALWRNARPLVYGDLDRMQYLAERFAIPVHVAEVESPEGAAGTYPRIDVIDLADIGAEFPFGSPSARSGRAALDYIEAAARDAIGGQVAALVTAPIAKDAIRMAGSKYNGHTDMLADMTHARRHAMTLVAGKLRAIFVTDHVALAEVSARITHKRVLDTIELAAEALTLLGEEGRPIAITGVNPHAGEGGIFGAEETEKIIPAIEAAKSHGINCVGPIAGDVAFHRMYRGDYAIVVTMYHDLGHAPIKMIAMDEGVNWTVGLPIIRTSPDHGTAWDIAGTGQARPTSFKNAYQLACRIVAREGAPL